MKVFSRSSFSPFYILRSAFCVQVVLLLLIAAAANAAQPELRVCADPNNLPFTNARGEGFENKIAELIAKDMGAKVTYTWWAQRRGMLRHTLRAGKCDVVMGVPVKFDPVLSTRPYYRSTYVFVYPKNKPFRVSSLDDPILRKAKIGVQIVGDDGDNPPPGIALARRGIIDNVRGYSVFGDYSQPNPPARIIEAVAKGDIDVAIVWGPLAGYFVPRQRVPLAIVPVRPLMDPGPLPFSFDISMGVRPGDVALKTKLEQILARHRAEVDAILAKYGVPRSKAPVLEDVTPKGDAR